MVSAAVLCGPDLKTRSSRPNLKIDVTMRFRAACCKAFALEKVKSLTAMRVPAILFCGTAAGASISRKSA